MLGPFTRRDPWAPSDGSTTTGARFKARTSPDVQLGAGAAVRVRFDPAKLHFFEPGTGTALT